MLVNLYEDVSPHLHVLEHLEEGESHATADDHLVHLVQHVVDQLNLIFDFGPVTMTDKQARSFVPST